MSTQPRRFSEDEFALVLRKAVELQDHRGGSATPDGGLTLDEMKAVAADVGIGPEWVEQAVAALPEERHAASGLLLGGPTRYRLEHSTSRTLGQDDLARIMDAIRRETRHHGKVTSELGGITWVTEGEVSQFHVDLSPREGVTEIRISVNRDAAFIITWFFSVAGFLVAAGITGGVINPETFMGAAALVGGALTGGLGLARTLWGRSSKAIRAKAERLMDVIAREVGRDPEV